MSIRSLVQKLADKFTPGTYAGPLVGFVPVDAALSLLAKRSYWMYRAWDAYARFTHPYFGEPRAQENAVRDSETLATLRARGYALVHDAFDPGEVANAR